MTVATQGGAPDGRLPWANLGLPRWGVNPKHRNFKTYASGWCAIVDDPRQNCTRLKRFVEPPKYQLNISRNSPLNCRSSIELNGVQ